MPVERRGLTGGKLSEREGKPLGRESDYGKTLSRLKRKLSQKAKQGAGVRDGAQLPVHACGEEPPGEPDAGNPHVRFEEGGVSRDAGRAATEARTGKP
jgi:hypothetical protein